ncbi:hypothetical protein FH972_016104 [Carpinus fangiana]|uniref:DNA polymerase delta subunit 4 n=1 Tax=Carpinus fangiana TaxID=176857 RepID=A0A5N6RI89_9ROSI|nr:hypothetical protein FH972_016104 [Carpinus fangiana]
MATTSGNIKGFYRQRKNSGVTKSSSNTKKASKPSSSFKRSPKGAATFGSDVTQPTALLSQGSPDLKGLSLSLSLDDYEENENVLREFDMNMAYGPCLGMTRLARWERARALGLNPPGEIEGLLKAGKVGIQCLWDGRV